MQKLSWQALSQTQSFDIRKSPEKEFLNYLKNSALTKQKKILLFVQVENSEPPDPPTVDPEGDIGKILLFGF